MSVIRARISVKANVGLIDVKGALTRFHSGIAPGRNYNPECESCQ